MLEKSGIEDIVSITVSLYVDGKPSLWVLLNKEGSINRLGTGGENNTENDLYIGVTSSETFENLRKEIAPETLKFDRAYTANNILGKTCELQIVFQAGGNTQTGSSWTYGTQSSGPPPEIRRLAIAAVKVTEGWFQEFKKQKNVGGERQ